MPSRRKVSYRWVILLVGFTSIICGYVCRNTFSVFYPAIVDGFGWTRGDTGLIFSINSLAYGLSSPVAGALTDRLPPRYVLAGGALLVGTGMALCSTATELWQFVVLYGVVVGMGLSLIGWAPVSTLAARWFVERRALAFGVLGAAAGMSYVSAYVAHHVIAQMGWNTAYAAIGAFIPLVVVPLSLVLVRRKSIDTNQYKARISPDAHRQRSDLAERWHEKEWTLKQACRTYQFWLLFAMSLTAMGIVEQLAISHQVYFYMDAGYDALTATKFYGLFGVCFAAGNFVGALSDRTGRERFFIPTTIVCSLFVSLLVLLRDTSTPWLPPLIAVGFGLTFGTFPCLLNATIADLFHGRHYGQIAGMMVLAFALGGTVSPWLSGHLHDMTGSYTSTYAICVAALLATAVMMWFVAPRKVSPIAQHSTRQDDVLD